MPPASQPAIAAITYGNTDDLGLRNRQGKAIRSSPVGFSRCQTPLQGVDGYNNLFHMTAQRYELILETRQTEQFFLKEKQAFLLHFAHLFVSLSAETKSFCILLTYLYLCRQKRNNHKN